MRRLGLLVALSLALVAAAAADAGGATGLRGTVTRGPTQPVCREGEPCSAPAAGVVLVFRRSGRVVRTRTDGVGRYDVALVPGRWAVSLTTAGLGSRLSPALVVAVAGRVRVVDLFVDTGIR